MVEGDVAVEESKGDVRKGCVSYINETGIYAIKKQDDVEGNLGSHIYGLYCLT